MGRSTSELQKPSVPIGAPQPWRIGVIESLWAPSPTGLMACCCPCIVMAQVASRMALYGGYALVLGATIAMMLVEATSYVTATVSVDPHDGIGFALVRSAGLAAGSGLVFLLGSLRRNVRSRWHLEGSELEDILCALCCPPCTLAQLTTQVELYDETTSVFGPRNVLRRFSLEPDAL
ncbi:hypothetical protein, variant [Saprolegnia diclina VS20]|uniref:Uncharacterized protein n=1 Tax=Saprolegnia diclina (strain VS20) TaxID=1156394 RepID=T0Q3L3_SAPDV|nr:hypothetical protein, variant [Saprolegnia diclina VS20]XP_008618594.1 hypothetical protein SDRG_14256 [Saprolegnia diclina VS20]EQC27980.1 hypothetical protein SDRG_14256 [Saprolegnia diclina VS20]EQC27981.1 hypothetical protein, variant [Saprolegnia diclina VS20]|eukprot:XP_008618593.1 hypothetical protein, variant [Saprolegnia diclina VS20]